MNILISNSNNQPIYEQIYEQIKSAITSDELKSGDKLESIRNLAKDLRVSVITTKRAYEELEREGYIYTVSGKGSYVAVKNVELLREIQLKEIEGYMLKILQAAKTCSLTTDEMIEMFKVLSEEE